MRKIVIIAILSTTSFNLKAQVDELAQLALNIEKLAQFKQILSDLKKTYQVLYGGYSTIKNISSGNFNLHQHFLDGLLQVSPTVKQYKKIVDIIGLQAQLVKEYKAANARFRESAWFTPAELKHIEQVYGRLFKQSLQHLDALLNVVTPNKLRMNDAERINAIDHVFSGLQEDVAFLRQFNSSTSLLGKQRSKEQLDVDVSRQLYQLK
ncbi:MAG: TerB family tellurite resistance protein [Ferruginibacter sp.]